MTNFIGITGLKRFKYAFCENEGGANWFVYENDDDKDDDNKINIHDDSYDFRHQFASQEILYIQIALFKKCSTTIISFFDASSKKTNELNANHSVEDAHILSYCFLTKRKTQSTRLQLNQMYIPLLKKENLQ